MKTYPTELAPEQALAYIMAGHGKATIIGKTHRYTYRFSPSGPDSKYPKIFVSVLIGSNNEKDFAYLGYITKASSCMFTGKKGNPEHPAYRAFNWYYGKLCLNPTSAKKATFLHEGICGLCGRTLTTPESIARGFGPECIKHI